MNLARRALASANALALAMPIAGCALLSAPAESPSLHVLDARPVIAAAPETRDLVVEVSAPRAGPGFDTAQMAYMQKPHELAYYANNRWAERPAHMLGPLLARALEQSGAFRAIVQPPTVVPADVRLVVELARLQQDFAMRPSRVELSLRVQLLDLRGRRVLATRDFEATEAAASDDAAGGVAAANRALGRLLAEITSYCVAETAGLRPTTTSRP